MNQNRKAMSNNRALGIGGLLGLLGGLCLGLCFCWMTGAFFSGMWAFALVHATLAMIIMGAWLAPCFVTTESDSSSVAKS